MKYLKTLNVHRFSKRALLTALAIFAMVAVVVCLLIIENKHTNAPDMKVAQVDDKAIYMSEIEFVFNDVNRGLNLTDTSEIQMYKQTILENGIKEIIVINEALERGLTVDEHEFDEGVESIKNESGGLIFEMAVKRYGYERYLSDLRKRMLYNDMRNQILENADVSIEVNVLFDVAKEYDSDLTYDTFSSNISYYRSWYEDEKKEEIFSQWVDRVKSDHHIEYYHLFTEPKATDDIEISVQDETTHGVVDTYHSEPDIGLSAQSPQEYKLIMNNIAVTPQARLYFDMNEHSFKQWSQEDVLEYFDVDLIFDLPAGLTQSDKPFFDQFGIKHDVDPINQSVVYDSSGNLVFDNVKYEYRDIWEDKYIPDLRKLTITLSKLTYPANCIPYDFDCAISTLVDNVSVYFGITEDGHTVAKGNNDDLYFTVEGDNITETELIKCVASIIMLTKNP